MDSPHKEQAVGGGGGVVGWVGGGELSLLVAHDWVITIYVCQKSDTETEISPSPTAEIVILVILYSAASDKNSIKMTPFPFQWTTRKYFSSSSPEQQFFNCAFMLRAFCLGSSQTPAGACFTNKIASSEIKWNRRLS